MKAENAEQEVQRIFKIVDKNFSGSIDYTGEIKFCFEFKGKKIVFRVCLCHNK